MKLRMMNGFQGGAFMRNALLSSAIVATPSLFANTLYVVPPGTAGNTPTAPYDTWVTAANDLATAVAAASSQDTILVGKGTYSITGSTPIVMSGDKHLEIRSCDSDNGGECNREETIFDGTSFTGSDYAIVIDSLTNAARKYRIEGFTFRNFPCSVLYLHGTSIGSPMAWEGSIAGCSFEDNGGSVNGGAIRSEFVQNAVVTNCHFSGNVATGKNGGAIYHSANFGHKIRVVDCDFSGKGTTSVAGKGGAIYAERSIDIRGCTFRDLSVSSTAGSVYGGNQASLSGCLFTGQLNAGSYAAAVALTSTYASISNTTFSGITSTTGMGCIQLTSAAGVEMYGCTFTNNVSLRSPLVFVSGSVGDNYRFPNKVRNCLVAASTAAELGGIFRFYNSTLADCVLAENCTLYMPDSSILMSNDAWADNIRLYSISFTNSVLVGTISHFAGSSISYGSCATSVNNDFVSPPHCDFRLKGASLLIDAGAPLGWHEGGTDLYGGVRVSGAAVDIGCCERHPGDSDYYAVVRAVASAADRTGDWAEAYVGLQAAVDAAPDDSLVLARSGTYEIGETVIISNRVLDVKSCSPATGEPDRDGTVLNGQGARRIMIVHHGPQSADYTPDAERPVHVEGFTFKDGWTRAGDGQTEAGQGGALLLYGRAQAAGMPHSSFADCCFTNCSAFNGGAVAAVGGTFERCVFAGNSAPETDGCGGAVVFNVTTYQQQQVAVVSGRENLWNCLGFIDCTFTNNAAQYRGGVLHAGSKASEKNVSCYVAGCRFLGNTSGNSGAVLNALYGAFVTNCMFVANVGGNYGVVRSLGNSTRICDCEFDGNNSLYGCFSGSGGESVEKCSFRGHKGISFYGSANVRNSLFADPGSNNSLVGFYGPNNAPVFENCTFARGDGKAIVSINGSFDYTAAFTNCIICCTDGYSPLFSGMNARASVTLANCCLSSEIPAADSAYFTTSGLLPPTVNPGFRDAAAGDYTLKTISPCRDAGLLLGWMDASATDLAGAPRVFGDAVDIGCYENQERPLGIMMIIR